MAFPDGAMIKRFAILISVALQLNACSESTQRPAGGLQVTCVPGGTDVFLASKFDDDDGDGNPYDEDFPTIDDEDDDIADHAWIQDNLGTYHLYFHTEGSKGGSRIDHYSTRDFRTLVYHGPVLTPTPGTFYDTHVWAPHIVRYGDEYLMFFTGVEGSGPLARQRIGVARSHDLHGWNHITLVYECDEPWTTWSAGGDFDAQCRDAFVAFDEAQQVWLMLVTAKSTNGYGAVVAATGNDPLQPFSGSGYIDATRRLAVGTGAQTTGGQAENPLVIFESGTNYLFFTDWQDDQDTVTVVNPRTTVQYATSTTLSTDVNGSANWVYRGYTPDVGCNAFEGQRFDGKWVLTQSISSEQSGVADLHRRHLRMRGIEWLGGGTFTTHPVKIEN